MSPCGPVSLRFGLSGEASSQLSAARFSASHHQIGHQPDHNLGQWAAYQTLLCLMGSAHSRARLGVNMSGLWHGKC